MIHTWNHVSIWLKCLFPFCTILFPFFTGFIVLFSLYFLLFVFFFHNFLIKLSLLITYLFLIVLLLFIAFSLLHSLHFSHYTPSSLSILFFVHLLQGVLASFTILVFLGCIQINNVEFHSSIGTFV